MEGEGTVPSLRIFAANEGAQTSTLESVRGDCQAGSGHQHGEFREEVSPEAGGVVAGGQSREATSARWLQWRDSAEGSGGGVEGFWGPPSSLPQT